MQHRGREGPEALPVLDLEVEALLHLRVPGVAQDGAVPQGPGPELHAALEPAHHLALGQEGRHVLEQFVKILVMLMGRHGA